tara:strand:+ start:6856 stop:7278 length:423 start_codon:yes stop_codon:yes gene_type:complete
MALINGVSYDFVSVRIVIANVPITGIQELKYKEEQEVTGNLGTGNRVHSVGFGGIESGATIGLSMNEVEKMRDAVKIAGFASGSLLQFPFFDIIVVYDNPQRVVTHTLRSCRFKTDEGGGSVGDTEITGSYDLFVAEISY